MKKRKSKKRKELESDLIFFLDYYSRFDKGFRKRIVDKEIEAIVEKLKKSD